MDNDGGARPKLEHGSINIDAANSRKVKRRVKKIQENELDEGQSESRTN